MVVELVGKEVHLLCRQAKSQTVSPFLTMRPGDSVSLFFSASSSCRMRASLSLICRQW